MQRSIQFVQQKQGRPKFEVEHCIAHILGMRRFDLYLQFDRPLEAGEVQQIRQAVLRLSKNEPLAHIQGFSYFYRNLFEVSSNVLIPRPETEVLVETVRKYLDQVHVSTGTIVDVCCGCGCVGLSLKALFPNWTVILIDISQEAVCITRRNASRLQLDVEIFQGDLLDPLAEREVDVIVANPPYLSVAEYEQLDSSVKDFEPKLALVGGDTGLEIYLRLSKVVPAVLKQNGLYAVEIGATQGAQVSQLLSFCRDVHIARDFSDFDRVIAGFSL